MIKKMKIQSKARRIIEYYGSVADSVAKNEFFGGDAHITLPQPIPANNLDLLSPFFCNSYPASSIAAKLAYSRNLRTYSPIKCVSFSYDGSRVFISNEKGEIHEWLVYKGFPHPNERLDCRIVTTDSKSISCFEFMKDGTYFLTGDMEGIVMIYRPNIEKMLALKAHASHKSDAKTYSINSISPSPTNFMFCSAAEDTTIKIWDLGEISNKGKRRKPIRKLDAHGGNVLTVDWHPSKGLIVSGSEDSNIKLWDPRNKNCIGTIDKHTAKVRVVSFNKNGNWLLSTSDDRSCRIFDIRVNKELQSFKGHSQGVNCAKWHPVQEDVFASGADDGKIIHWIVGSDGPQNETQQHLSNSITCLSWHPIGNLLITGSANSCVKLWVRAKAAETFRI